MFTTMDPKLMCPTLTIMLTKTIKALCEVNIKFEKNLEISGSLHVRSDGEKILTCLIDEESIRPPVGSVLQQRNTPETALAQQSAVMALLTASQQMAANRSPGLASPPVRNFTPTAPIQAADMTNRHAETPGAHLQQVPARSTHNAMLPTSHDAHAPVSVQNSSPQEGRSVELHRLPPVNSLIQNREVLLGMLQDKSRNKQEKHAKTETHSGGKNQYQTANSEHSDIKEEPCEQGHTPEHKMPQLAVTNPTAHPPSTANGSMAPSIPPIATLPNLSPFPVLVNAGAGWPPNVPQAPQVKTPRTEAESPPQDPEIVTTINSKGQKKFQCMFCGILLSTKNYLKNHINAVHTKARVYPCEICERYFYSAGALRIHKLRHHWAGSKKHKCPHCQDSFLLPVELRRHLVKKHGDTSGGATDGEEMVVKEGHRPSPNLTIEQIRQLQLQEHLRAQQQQLLEQEQAISQLQHHIGGSEQGEPLELSMRADDSDQPEPGEITNDTMHSQMTDSTPPGGCDALRAIQEEPVQQEVVHTEPLLPAILKRPPGNPHVIVQPEPPPEVTHMEVGEMHPNQNEVGIPDDDIEEEDDEEEIRDVTPGEIPNKQRVQSHAHFVPQPSPAIEIGNNIG